MSSVSLTLPAGKNRPTAEGNLYAALAYVDEGWQVLALHCWEKWCSCGRRDCATPGKHPRTQHGVHDATTDPAVLREWWTRWPNANIGVATGPGSGVWMLGPDGEEGLADLERLCAEHGEPVPITRRSRSGSGGAHLLFRWPKDGPPITNQRNHRGLRIDIRGAAGYFVAPPSTNAKGPYVWTEGREPIEAPAWLLEWVRGKSVGPVRPSGRPRPGVIERAIAYLAKCPPAVSGQGGHAQTFAVARALAWGFDLGEEETLRLLQEHYNPRCSPPWSEKELAHKAHDAATKDYGKPRGYLLDADRDLSPVGRVTADRRGGVPAEPPPLVWSPPIPLTDLPPVPPFPLHVLPAKVADYWQAAAESMNAPVDYVAAPGLAVLGAAVGRSRAAEIAPGHTQAPCLWVAVVGPPGSAKSPALARARAPLARAERQWRETHGGEMSLFEAETERYAAKMKEWKTGGCEGEPPQKPRKPTLRQVVLDDATTEAVVRVLAENPRGVLNLKDELTAFLRGMDQYRSGGRGADRQFWLSAWAGAPAKINRAKDHEAGPLVIPHPFVALAGVLCPGSLPELRGDGRRGEGDQDGFLDRFLFAYPDPLPAVGEQWRTVAPELEEGYCEVVGDLLAMEMVAQVEGPGAEPEYRPYFVRFGHNARAEWERFTARLADRINACEPHDPFRGVLSKLRGYGGRLAALLWCVRRVCGLVAEGDCISEAEVAGAAELVDYFARHAERAHARGWADQSGRIARRLLAWLARDPDRTMFSKTEAFQQLKDGRSVTNSAALAPALTLLADHGHIRPVGDPVTHRPGPNPEVYLVNPAWDRSTPGLRPQSPHSSTEV